ncbi:hypothetical protein ACHAXR_008847 [Thalassiosira sp. AJA248-18]
MTSAIRIFNKLSPRMKALYVTCLVVSVALMVFGAVLLTSAGLEVSTSTSTSSVEGGGGGVVGSEDGKSGTTLMDDDDYYYGTPLPTESHTALDSTPQPPTPLSTDSPWTATHTPIFPTMTPSRSNNNYLRPVVESKQPQSLSPTMKQTLRTTSEPPSGNPSASPTDSAVLTTNSPSDSPISPPSTSPSHPPTMSIAPTASHAPTPGPLFPTHAEPPTNNKKSTYFNYNVTLGARYGPSVWENATVLNSTEENYWSEFGFVENQCNKDKVAQSPVDVCTKPERHCEEYHEFRSKVSTLYRGDFKISGEFMLKQILPNKLRVLVTRRMGDEPDPPHADFAGVGAKDLDLLNIDIKFPAEHTICGRRYVGEMQYYFFHPVKMSLLVVAWLFEAKVDNPVNEHMQLLIDEYQEMYDINEDNCAQRGLEADTSSLNNASTHTLVLEEDSPFKRKLAKNNDKKGGGIWDPFHSDIQKTIHFWGYTGSLTEPPCAANTLWRIMDVPVQISAEQLYQMQNILFNNRNNETCAFSSTHYKGSVARPISESLRYYKCTRSDYVSDDERELCEDSGCINNPFGTGLDPYTEPIIHVTGPPSKSPTMLPSHSPLVFYELV